jgi:ParB family chromosome partitioning protein
VSAVSPEQIHPNPRNPRRFFNEEALDLLRTSIEEVGILVPLIVYPDPDHAERYVLLDGERRWLCATDLGLSQVPVNTIEAPTDLENLLRMFNIHAVREEWPLISIALSLQEVIATSGETRESRLSELTGLPRGRVRRAKKLLELPLDELTLIREEAHLDRAKQVHREDLYIEIVDAIASIEKHLPELAEEYGRERLIRQFAQKREADKLRAITDFRGVPKLLQAVTRGEVPRARALSTVRHIIDRVDVNPLDAADEASRGAFERQELSRRVTSTLRVIRALAKLEDDEDDGVLRVLLTDLRAEIDRLLGR